MDDVPAKTVESLHDTDAAVTKAAAPYRTTLPVRALSLFSELGDQPQMRALCGAVIAGGLVTGNRRLAGTGIRMLAAHTLATAAKNFVKRRVDRTRPRNFHEGKGDHRIKPGHDQSKEETSFPSGHTAGAVAVARAFARGHPEHATPAYTAAGAISLAQIPRCAHYPTDVGAGAAIGVVSEMLVSAVERLGASAVERRSKPEPKG